VLSHTVATGGLPPGRKHVHVHVHPYPLGVSLLLHQATTQQYRGLGCRSPREQVSGTVVVEDDSHGRPGFLAWPPARMPAPHTWFGLHQIWLTCMNQSNSSLREARASLSCNSTATPPHADGVMSPSGTTCDNSWTASIEVAYCQVLWVRVRLHKLSLMIPRQMSTPWWASKVNTPWSTSQRSAK
jgi:hypothetical protein